MKKILLILSLLLPLHLLALNVTVGFASTTYVVNGSNDEVEIQQAIDAVSVSGGGTVTLMAGTYLIQSTSIKPKSNVTIVGVDKATVILSSNRTYDYIFSKSHGTAYLQHFQLDNITLDVQNAQNASGIRLEYAKNILLKNINFRNVTCNGWHCVIGIDGGASYAGSQNIFSRDIQVEDCVFDGHAGSLEMLLLYNVKNVKVNNCIFKDKLTPNGCATGGQPVIGCWQKTDSVSIVNCTFTNNPGYECIYYSNTSNNTLIESCTFTNSGGIRGSNESDWGTFGVPHATNLMIRNCVFKGGAFNTVQSAIQLGAVYNVLIKNTKIENYEEGVVIDKGNSILTANSLNDIAKHLIIQQSTIKNGNPTNNVHPLHSGVLNQNIAGKMHHFYVCDSIYDTQNSPTQQQSISHYCYPNSCDFDSLYYLGGYIQSYMGHPKFRFLNSAMQGTSFIDLTCNSTTPPSYCNICPNMTDAGVKSLIENYDLTTATIYEQLAAYQVQNIPLPLNIISFVGKAHNKYHYLNWTTQGEEKVLRYELQKTVDGINYESIATFNSKKTKENNYEYKYYNEIQSDCYYRIKSIFSDGSYEFSVSVALKSADNNVVTIYPNPTESKFYISAQNLAQPLILFNANGQLIISYDEVPSEIDLQSLPLGIYWIKIGEIYYKIVRV